MLTANYTLKENVKSAYDGEQDDIVDSQLDTEFNMEPVTYNDDTDIPMSEWSFAEYQIR